MPARWVISWDDETGNPDYRIREVAESPQEAEEVIRRILTGYTWTPEEADEIGGAFTEPAYPSLVRDWLGGDVVTGLEAIPQGRPLKFACDDGTLEVDRC